MCTYIQHQLLKCSSVQAFKRSTEVCGGGGGGGGAEGAKKYFGFTSANSNGNTTGRRLDHRSSYPDLESGYLPQQ